jgi:hypothetical protein
MIYSIWGEHSNQNIADVDLSYTNNNYKAKI